MSLVIQLLVFLMLKCWYIFSTCLSIDINLLCICKMVGGREAFTFIHSTVSSTVHQDFLGFFIISLAPSPAP